MIPSIPTLEAGGPQPDLLSPPAWFPRMASPSEAVAISDDAGYLGHEFRAGFALLMYTGEWDLPKVRYAVTQLQMGIPWLAAWLCQVAVRHPYIFIPLRQRGELPNGADAEVLGGDRGAARRAKEGFAAEMLRARTIFPDFERSVALMGYQWIQAVWDTSTVPWGLTLLPVPAASTYQDALGRWWMLAVEGRVAMHHGDGKFFFVGSGVTPCNNGAIVCLGEQWAGGRFAFRDQAAVMANAGLVAPVVETAENVKPDDPVGIATVQGVEDFVAERAGIVLWHGSKMGKFPGVDPGTAKLFTDYLGENESICHGAIVGTPAKKSTAGVYLSPQFQHVEEAIVRASLGSLAAALTLIGRVYGRYNFDLLPENSPGYRWNLPDSAEQERIREQLARHESANKVVAGWIANGTAPTEDAFAALEASAGFAPGTIPRPKDDRPRIEEWHWKSGVVGRDQVLAQLQLPLLGPANGGADTILDGAAKLAKTAATEGPPGGSGGGPLDASPRPSSTPPEPPAAGFA